MFEFLAESFFSFSFRSIVSNDDEYSKFVPSFVVLDVQRDYATVKHFIISFLSLSIFLLLLTYKCEEGPMEAGQERGGECLLITKFRNLILVS